MTKLSPDSTVQCAACAVLIGQLCGALFCYTSGAITMEELEIVLRLIILHDAHAMEHIDVEAQNEAGRILAFPSA